MSLAWDAFGNNNGTIDYHSFSKAIHKYRKSDRRSEPDPIIGCIILTSPFFFERSDWLPVPEDWKSNIVQGKSYSTDTMIGKRLYQQVEERLIRIMPKDLEINKVCEADNVRYGGVSSSLRHIGRENFASA